MESEEFQHGIDSIAPIGGWKTNDVSMSSVLPFVTCVLVYLLSLVCHSGSSWRVIDWDEVAGGDAFTSSSAVHWSVRHAASRKVWASYPTDCKPISWPGDRQERSRWRSAGRQFCVFCQIDYRLFLFGMKLCDQALGKGTCKGFGAKVQGVGILFSYLFLDWNPVSRDLVLSWALVFWCSAAQNLFAKSH